MKIDKEQFDKLKQLDRIEFRQREDRIKKLSGTNPLEGYVLGIMGLVILSTLIILKQISSQVYVELLYIGLLAMVFSILLMVISLLTGVAILFIKSKLLKELQEEYFKVEVKK